MVNKDVFKVVTDERLVIDVVAPGFGKDAITVKTTSITKGQRW